MSLHAIARWCAAQAEVFVQVEQDFRAGDRIQLTRNKHRAHRLDGQTAEVVAIDPEGSSMVVAREDGRREMLDLAHLTDRQIRPGWVRDIHSARGAKCNQVIAHLRSSKTNTVDAATVYVAISRAKKDTAVYTDSRVRLTDDIK